ANSARGASHHRREGSGRSPEVLRGQARVRETAGPDVRRRALVDRGAGGTEGPRDRPRGACREDGRAAEGTARRTDRQGAVVGLRYRRLQGGVRAAEIARRRVRRRADDLSLGHPSGLQRSLWQLIRVSAARKVETELEAES